MILDLIATVLREQEAACRIEGTVIKSTFLGVDGKWRRIMFIVEGDMIYAVKFGVEHAACVNDPNFDMEEWVRKLRIGCELNNG